MASRTDLFSLLHWIDNRQIHALEASLPTKSNRKKNRPTLTSIQGQMPVTKGKVKASKIISIKRQARV